MATDIKRFDFMIQGFVTSRSQLPGIIRHIAICLETDREMTNYGDGNRTLASGNRAGRYQEEKWGFAYGAEPVRIRPGRVICQQCRIENTATATSCRKCKCPLHPYIPEDTCPNCLNDFALDIDRCPWCRWNRPRPEPPDRFNEKGERLHQCPVCKKPLDWPQQICEKCVDKIEYPVDEPPAPGYHPDEDIAAEDQGPPDPFGSFEVES